MRATRGESNLIFTFSGPFFLVKLTHGLRLACNVGNFERGMAGAGYFYTAGQLADSYINGAFCMVAIGGCVFDICVGWDNTIGGFG